MPHGPTPCQSCVSHSLSRRAHNYFVISAPRLATSLGVPPAQTYPPLHTASVPRAAPRCTTARPAQRCAETTENTQQLHLLGKQAWRACGASRRASPARSVTAAASHRGGEPEPAPRGRRPLLRARRPRPRPPLQPTRRGAPLLRRPRRASRCAQAVEVCHNWPILRRCHRPRRSRGRSQYRLRRPTL